MPFAAPERHAEPAIKHAGHGAIRNILGQCLMITEQARQCFEVTHVIVNVSPFDDQGDEERVLIVRSVRLAAQEFKRLLKVLVGLFKSIPAQTLLAGLHEIVDGLMKRSPLFEMVSERFIELGEPLMEQRLHHLADPFMDFLTLLFEESVVDHLLSQGMLEDIFQIRLKCLGSDQIQPFQSYEPAVVLILELGDLLQDLVEERSPDHGRLLEKSFCFPFQPIQSSCDNSMDGGRDVGFPDRARDFPLAVFFNEGLRLDQRTHQFFYVKRIPFGLVLHEPSQCRGNLVTP